MHGQDDLDIPQPYAYDLNDILPCTAAASAVTPTEVVENGFLTHSDLTAAIKIDFTTAFSVSSRSGFRLHVPSVLVLEAALSATAVSPV